MRVMLQNPRAALGLILLDASVMIGGPQALSFGFRLFKLGLWQMLVFLNASTAWLG